MYESYFKLTKKPFDLVPNPEFLFLSRSHRRALIHFDYGIHERAGFILLTGEVGSGKTTLIRDLINKRPAGVVLSKVFNTCVDFEQFLVMVNEDFGLSVGDKDRSILLRDLNDFLIEQYSQGNKPTLIIDEAQNLSTGLLEDIRMLSNLEADDYKLLQIIMVGQPELRNTLSLPGLRQLRQRISINCHLAPLNRQEVEEYILHRLEVAGNREAVMFFPDSIDIISRFSRGIPRLINIICDFLMLSAFAEETQQIDGEMVRSIISDLDFESHYWGESVASNSDDVNFCSSGEVRFSDKGTQKSEIECLLMEVINRLDTLEKKAIISSGEYIEELGKRLDQTEQSFCEYMKTTTQEISGLSQALQITKDNDSLAAPLHKTGEDTSRKKGFLGKLFRAV